MTLCKNPDPMSQQLHSLVKPQICVKKFGGTSVGSIERIEAIAERLAESAEAGQTQLVVVSAMAGETNRLVHLAAQIDPAYRGAAYDMLLASGEQVSVALLAIALEKRGYKARPLLAYQLGLRTDSVFSKAKIKSIESGYLIELCQSGVIPIVAGFQGATSSNEITTLGRGGSDTTAVAIAASLGAKSCEIYTDVPAVFTADPRLVPLAQEVAQLSYEEMMEMAILGSKVLHFRCVEIAAKFKVAIHVRSTFERRDGTWIMENDPSKKAEEQTMLEDPVVSAITHESSTLIFKLFPIPQGVGFKADLFRQLAEAGVVVDIISQTQNADGQWLAFSVTEEDEALTTQVLKKFMTSEMGLEVHRDLAKISIIGVGMKNTPGVAARFFDVLDRCHIPIHLVTTSEIKVSALVPRSELSQAARALHAEFGLDRQDQ